MSGQEPLRTHGRVKWITFGVVVLLVAGPLVWYTAANSAYQREQQAIQSLSALFNEDRVVVLGDEEDAANQYNPAEVDLVVSLAADEEAWLHRSARAVWGPVLDRVRTVKIYEPRFTDEMVDQLIRFRSMTALHLPPAAGEDRAVFIKLGNEAKHIAVYIEHDNEDFARGYEEGGEGDDEGEWEEEDEEAVGNE